MDNKLEALQKIIEVGSFTKAAEILGYTQSAISQMISSLEKEMSIKLLYRSKRGVQLTPEGEEVYPFIQKLLTQQILLSEKVTQINHLESGVVRIGAYASISRHWLPKIIKQFQAQYPKVKFVIHQGDYTTITQWISNGKWILVSLVPMRPVVMKVNWWFKGNLSQFCPNIIVSPNKCRSLYKICSTNHYC